MQLSSLAILVILFTCAFAAYANKNATVSYERCLHECKKSLPADSVPTACFEQCVKPKKQPKQPKSLKCRIPIMKLQCKEQPVATPNTTLSDAENTFDLPVNAENLWAAYHTELLRFLTKGNTASLNNFNGLQLMTTPLPAEWDDNDERFQVMATRVSKFQGVYEPGMGHFDENYCEGYVPNLDFQLGANPQGEATIQNLYAQQDALTSQMMTEEMKCEDRFNALSSSLRRRYASFDEYAKKSCSTLNYLLSQASVIKGQIEYTYNMFAGGRKEMEARAAVLKCKNTKRKFMELNTLKDFMANINAGRMNPFNIEVNQLSTESQAKSSFKSMGLTLVVINFSMNKAMRSLTTSMKDFRLKISAKSFGAINVAPEPTWFNGDVFSQWRNGPFRNGKTSANFFGQGGSISLLPKTYYLVYQPTVEFSLNQKDTDEFEKQSSFSVSLAIYYVSFSFGQSRKVSKFKESENLYRIRIEDNSPTPQVIAVNNIVL